MWDALYNFAGYKTVPKYNTFEQTYDNYEISFGSYWYPVNCIRYGYIIGQAKIVCTVKSSVQAIQHGLVGIQLELVGLQNERLRIAQELTPEVNVNYSEETCFFC